MKAVLAHNAMIAEHYIRAFELPKREWLALSPGVVVAGWWFEKIVIIGDPDLRWKLERGRSVEWFEHLLTKLKMLPEHQNNVIWL